jgi:uncharacterized protein (TIGR02145 family)
MKKAVVCFSFAIIALFLLSFYACSDDETPANNNTNPNTVTDVDGNVYHTIKIGTQTWTVENLKVTRYRNGDLMPNITGNLLWEMQTTGAYSSYDNNTKNLATYGGLYNWYAVKDNRGLAPTGWHIPTEAEWTTLRTYLGTFSNPGGKMKETDTLHWLTPNTGATNESGFNGLPGGLRFDVGGYEGIREQANFWTATEQNTNLAYYSNLMYNTTNLTITSFGKTCGFSVRCVKN